MKIMQKELKNRKKLRTARCKEKEKLESHCLAMNNKKLWDSVKAMTNVAPTKRCINGINERDKANELNNLNLINLNLKTSLKSKTLLWMVYLQEKKSCRKRAGRGMGQPSSRSL